MKQLEVQIMGQSYLLGCPENGDARMLDAVNRVDIAMCKIRDVGKIKARDRIAVLAALNLAFELTQHPVAVATPLFAGDGDAAHPAGTSAFSDTLTSQLTALVQRMDAALDVDGHLLSAS
jgi:cell division protein ZapA